MSLPSISVKKPVTTIMFVVGAILLGFISWNRLPQELFPSVTYPQITIATTYENAAPEEIETLITRPVEEAVGTVNNVKKINSVSKEGISLVTAEFIWGTNMDFAALGVREKIDLIKERLPREAEEPVVMKYNPFDLPIMTLSVTGPRTPLVLRELAKKKLKDELEKIEGVASCNITGGLEREILVELDGARLNASGISIMKVIDALAKSNLNYPAGTIKEQFYEYLIRTLGEFKLVSEIQDTVIEVKDDAQREQVALTQLSGEEKVKSPRQRLLELSELADIRDTVKEKTSISRYNGKENVSVSIQKQAGENTVLVAGRVRRQLETIRTELPNGVKAEVVYDQSGYIQSSISGLLSDGISGGILAFLVLLFYIRNLRMSLIVIVSIPISVLVAISFMYFHKITINMMSLGGLALGVGMLVDAAIVVLENIQRIREEKGAAGQGFSNAKEIASFGATEVAGAVAGSVLTTVAVFLPMVFVTGIAGQLFRELALTVTYSLLASLVMSLTLVPVLASFETKSTHSRKRPRPIRRRNNFFPKFLSVCFKHRVRTVLVATALFLASSILLFNQDREFMPKLDQGQFIVKLDMPTGTRLEVTDDIARRIEQALLGLREVKDVTVNVGSSKEGALGRIAETLGSHQAQILINLIPNAMTLFKKITGRRDRPPTSEIVQRLKMALEKEDLQGAKIEYVLQESVFKTALGGAAPIVVQIKGDQLTTLEGIAQRLKAQLSNVKGVYGIKDTLTLPAPETKVLVNKDKAATYHIATRDVALSAQAAVRGYVATHFKEAGKEIDVRVRLREGDRRDIAQLRNILVHSPLDIEVPLVELAYLASGVGPSQIERYDQERAVIVTANIQGRKFADIVDEINGLLKALKKSAVPEGYAIELAGENLQVKESFTSLRFALLLALLLVYMIMASEFESLWQPFVIMFTVPLSIIGVAFGLFLTGTSISAIVLLGVILLGGIVVDNGIVLIDYVNNLRGKGVEKVEATIKASRVRLRPIMMTSLTTILGLVPLALGIGEGAELRTPMALTVMAGLTLSTFLTLVVIPAVYLLMSDFVERKKKKGRPGPSSKTEAKKETKPKAPEEAMVESAKKEEGVQEPVKALQEVPETARAVVPTVIGLPPSPVESMATVHDSKEGESRENSGEVATEVKSEGGGLRTKLNDRQALLLEYLAANPRITRREYRERFGVTRPTAQRDLNALIKTGLLLAKGTEGYGRWYEIPK